MKKYYLLAPGPTPIPPEVLQALSRPILHHRPPEFEALFARVRAALAELCETRSEVLVLVASGTGAMEAAVVNLLSPGDEALVVRCGKFGERWAGICDAFGDTVSSFGAVPCPMDAWGVDVVVTGSQKGLMCPPGLAFIALGERAWRAAETARCPKFYWDLPAERTWQAKRQAQYTPAVPLLLLL